MAPLVQKLWGKKKLSKSVSGYFKTKKNPMTSRGGGGLKALVVGPLRLPFDH